MFTPTLDSPMPIYAWPFICKMFYENGRRSVPHTTSLVIEIHFKMKFWKFTRTIIVLRWMGKVGWPQKFKFRRQKRDLSEQFMLICAKTSWSMTLKKFMYHLHSMAQYILKFQPCRSKALAVVRGIRSKLATIIYIYRYRYVVKHHLLE